MVECKLSYTVSAKEASGVLIDTWWNVNTVKALKDSGFSGVLIDTWWNVNSGGDATTVNGHSFNRYMVECKLSK